MTAFTWRATGEDAQRAVIIGKTGSGKTTLACALVGQSRRAVWFDVKGLNDPGYPVVTADVFLDTLPGPWRAARLAQLFKELGPHITVQLATRPGVKDEAQVDATAEAAYELRNVLFVLDDAMGVLTSSPPYFLTRVITMGRAQGVGFLAITQRAHRVPLTLLTEAEHIVAFQLTGESDLSRLATEGDAALAEAADLERHCYLWYDREARSAQRFKPLRLQPARTVDKVPQQVG